MRDLFCIFFLIFTHIHLNAQLSIEITLPTGISNYANTEVADEYEYFQSPLHTTAQFGMGLDVSFCRWSLKQFEFLAGFSYRSLKFKAQQELEQESLAWTYRNINIQSTDHIFGIHLAPRYNFWVATKHSLGVQGKLGYMLTLRNETTIEMDQQSFFNPQRERFEYFISSFPGIKAASVYSGSLIYLYGQSRFRLKLQVGYEYFHRRTFIINNDEARDWVFFHSSLGLKLFL